MILTCPACGTQYVVKDGAIPEGGRKVRCASCRHSWHQDPEPVDEPLELEQAVDPAAPEGAEGYEDSPAYQADADDAGATDHDMPATGDEVEPEDFPAGTEIPAGESESALDEDYGSAVTATQPEPMAPAGDPYADADDRVQEAALAGQVDDDFSPFAERTPADRRRRSPMVAVLLVVVLVAALAAAFWFLAPAEWKARIGLTAAGQTPLQLMMTHSDRQALASGNELLAVSGRVINPTRSAQRVPPIQAELRSSSGKVVYRWTIAPPTQTLAPGASARFNSAEVNVPAGGEELTVSLGAPGA